MLQFDCKPCIVVQFDEYQDPVRWEWASKECEEYLGVPLAAWRWLLNHVNVQGETERVGGRRGWRRRDVICPSEGLSATLHWLTTQGSFRDLERVTGIAARTFRFNHGTKVGVIRENLAQLEGLLVHGRGYEEMPQGACPTYTGVCFPPSVHPSLLSWHGLQINDQWLMNK
jgi:hypothetical protein